MKNQNTSMIIIGVSLSNLFIKLDENLDEKKLIATLPNNKEICISKTVDDNSRWEYDFYNEFNFDGKFYIGVTDIEIELELYKPKKGNVNLNDIIIGIKIGSIAEDDDDLVIKIDDDEIIKITDVVRKQLTHQYSYFDKINIYLMNSLL